MKISEPEWWCKFRRGFWRCRDWLKEPVWQPKYTKLPAEPAEKSEPLTGDLTVTAGGRTATAHLSVDGGGDGGSGGGGDGGAGKAKGGDGGPIAAGVYKFAAAAVAGITATGLIVAVGAAVIWIRFNEVGIPGIQAVSVQPKYEALVQGGQETILFLLVGLVAVLLIFFADPGGTIRRITLLAFALLFAAAVCYLLNTTLGTGLVVTLSLLAFLLLLGCMVVGRRTDSQFWPLALAVFIAALVFSATSSLLVVQQQRFVQAVAILRGDSDTGLTGVYVAAGDKTIYFAQLSSNFTKSEKGEKMALLEVAREGATYSVGPLESEKDATGRAEEMLTQLIANRERGGTAAKAPTKPAADDAKGAAGSGGDDEPKADKAPTEAVETVAKAFGGSITVHQTVRAPWNCLVRYASAELSTLGRWWTSCEEAKKLESDAKTMLEIRDALALPGRFQPAFDMRVQAGLPLGKDILYLEGEIGPQCEHEKPVSCGYEYPGGSSAQIFLPNPQQATVTGVQCTSSAQNKTPIKWEGC